MFDQKIATSLYSSFESLSFSEFTMLRTFCAFRLAAFSKNPDAPYPKALQCPEEIILNIYKTINTVRIRK